MARFEAIVSADLRGLIPAFLDNRRKELQSLATALAAADFEQLRQLGHRMKGVGQSYGFRHVSIFGLAIEQGAKASNKVAIATVLDAYGKYLANLTVRYEES